MIGVFMKKIGYGFVVVAIVLAGCASTNDVVGTASGVVSLFQAAVKQRCESEIISHQYYNLASVMMTDEQKTSVMDETLDKTCSCVAKKAPESVTMTEIATAAIDDNQRPVIVAKAVTTALQSCLVDSVK